MILTYTWLAVAITALLLHLRQVYSKISRDGVRHLPVVPFFGNLFWVFMKKEHMIERLMKTMTAFPDDRVVGHYDLVKPVYLIRDVEAMKRISIKDFEHFMDRPHFTSDFDPLFGRGLLTLNGDEWKAMRSTMMPAFTSSKVRLMVPFMEEVGKELIKVLKEKIRDTGNPYMDVEIRDTLRRYSSDVIASCAFGLKVNSQTEDPEFYRYLNEVTEITLQQVLKIFFFRCFPSIAQMMKLSIVSRDASDYFTNVFLGAMRDREEMHIVRNDMINIMMEVKRGRLVQEKEGENTDADFPTAAESHVGKKQLNYEWSDADLVAQAALFLFAGFDTVSTSMTFLLYELAVNPDVQDRLVQEIREHDQRNGGQIDYNSIQNMTYLDMVVSEGLRLWPPSVVVQRKCVKDYNIGRPNSQATKDLIIRAGSTVVISPWAIQRYPKNFVEPAKFDPDRFSPENREKIVPYTYIPYGMGPRNCIGSRFAMCEMKVLVYVLLREMELYPCEQTCYPAELSSNGFNLELKGGAWARIRVRPQK